MSHLMTKKENDIVDEAYAFTLNRIPTVQQLRYFVRLLMTVKGVEADLFSLETVEEIINVFKEDGHVKA